MPTGTDKPDPARGRTIATAGIATALGVAAVALLADAAGWVGSAGGGDGDPEGSAASTSTTSTVQETTTTLDPWTVWAEAATSTFPKLAPVIMDPAQRPAIEDSAAAICQHATAEMESPINGPAWLYVRLDSTVVELSTSDLLNGLEPKDLYRAETTYRGATHWAGQLVLLGCPEIYDDLEAWLTTGAGEPFYEGAPNYTLDPKP